MFNGWSIIYPKFHNIIQHYMTFKTAFTVGSDQNDRWYMVNILFHFPEQIKNFQDIEIEISYMGIRISIAQ